MNAVAELGIIGAVSLAAAVGTWLVKGSPAAMPPPACNPAELGEGEICLADVAGDVLWVDARSRAEWMESGIEGSVLWNLDPREDESEMEAGVAIRMAAGAELVVVYCGSESCGTSRQIAERIRRLGLGLPVKTLHGGWDALEGRGGNPIRDSSSGP